MNKWLIPYSTANKLRKLSKPLFYETEWPLDRRRYVFHRVLVDSLQWIHFKLLDLGLEAHEANSEIFLLCCDLFNRFDRSKSSIVPYIENNISWMAAELIKKYNKQKEIPSGLLQLDEEYEIYEEYYLTSPAFLFENKWLARDLSQSQKNLILKILTNESLTLRSLANECRLSYVTIQTQLQNIATAIKDGY